MKYSRETFLDLIAKHEIVTMKEFRAKFPAAHLWYTRHREQIGALPLQYQKNINNFWTKENCAAAAKAFKHKSDFQEQKKGAYLKAHRAGWLDEICAHMTPKPYKNKGGRPGQKADNRIDMVGRRFGRWTVLSEAPKRAKRKLVFWTCRCDCGNVVDVDGNNLRSGLSQKCSNCSTKISKPQRELYEFVLSLGVKAVLGDRSTGREIDVYVPSHNFAIEYDGLLWHSSKFRATEALERTRYRHFKDKGITCFRVFEDEYLRAPELIKAMIAARLGKRPDKTPQSLKFIRLERPADARSFFEANHIDGYAGSKWAFGAYDGERLIACMTFRLYNKGRHKGQIELARFCSDHTYNTYGLFSKLLKQAKAFFKVNGFKLIVSASDNRLSKGAVYANNGFIEVKGADRRLNYYF